MVGLFGLLNIGKSSLVAEETASEVTGNNLANVNNPAYSREQVILQANDPEDTPIGEEGTGVDAATIEQYRSASIDSQVVSQNSVTSSYGAQQSTLQLAEGYLDEQLSSSSSSGSTSSPTGITANMASLFSAFSSLAAGADSETIPNAQTVVAAAQNLATKFNQISANLTTVRNDANSAVQSGVTKANQDLTTIANLNEQIASATESGQTADTLVDQRQAALQDLANYTNISTSTESNGSVDVSIGGVSMVSGFTNPDQLEAYNAGGGQTLVKAQNAGTTLSITGGSIGGNIAVTAPDGALTALQTGLDNAASALITQVNSVYNASTGQNFFTGTNAATIGLNSSVDASTLLSGVQADGNLASNLNDVASASIASLGNQTLGQSYAGTVSALGSAIDNATDEVNTSQSVAQMLSNQQSSVSGVSTDEEMTNLIEYQKAYEASAELISTVSSMLETVINMDYMQ